MVIDLLEQQHLLLSHGTGFNLPTADHLRMVFLAPVDVLDDAIRLGRSWRPTSSSPATGDLGVVVGASPYGTDIRATTTPRSRRSAGAQARVRLNSAWIRDTSSRGLNGLVT